MNCCTKYVVSCHISKFLRLLVTKNRLFQFFLCDENFIFISIIIRRFIFFYKIINYFRFSPARNSITYYPFIRN